MTDRSNPRRVGRQAGVAYLVIIVFSMAGYLTLNWLFGAAGAEPDPARLGENQALFSLAFVASAVGYAAWLPLGILLYRLMSSSGRFPALLLLTLVVAGTAANLIALAQLSPLLRPASGLAVGALGAAVHEYNRLLLLAQVFSGLWLFPFGWLVLRSRIAPRVLAFCLMAGGIFYSLTFATAFEPQLDQTAAYRVVSTVTGILGFAGELGMCLWLLIRGARGPNLPAVA